MSDHLPFHRRMDAFRQQLQDAIAPDYELERELGGGGMSRVFVATERALGRRVVVKVLSPELAAGVNAERFRREIQLAARLHHPHIVPLLNAGERGDLLYYTMPFIEGQSLRSALRERGRLPVKDVVRMLHDVVDALAYAHARGIIHRDIKPDNILLHGAHALVTDFGVAKAISAALPHAGHTTTGMAIGTPAYMAPEQLAADPAADHRMDLYAVGLVAYELLTGASPYSSTSPTELLAAQLTRTPVALHEVVPEVPPALSAVIMGTLEKDPAHRPPTAEALLAQLDAVSTPQGGLIAGAGAPTRRIDAPAAPRDARRSAMRGRRVRFAAATLGVIALVVLAFAAGSRAMQRRSTVTVGADSSTPPVDTAQLRAGDAQVAMIPGAANAGGARGTPLIITREESLAIAAAVHEKYGMEQQPAPGATAGTPDAVSRVLDALPTAVFAESLRAEIHRIYSDSLTEAIAALRRLADSQRVDIQMFTPNEPRDAAPRGPETPAPPDARGGRPSQTARAAAPILPQPAPNVRRILVAELRAPRRGASAVLAGMVRDSLRAVLARHPGWEVVDDATLRQLEHVDNAIALGFATRSDVVIGGTVSAARDSMSVRVHVVDPRTRAIRAVDAHGFRARDMGSSIAALLTRVEQEVERQLAASRRGR